MPGSLKFVDGGDDGIERASRCFPFVCFRIDAKKIFRAGGADHNPAYVAEIEFDAVEILAARDGEIQELSAFAVGKIGDGFLFLAGFYVEVNSAVVILAEFGVKRGEKFAERFAVPGHEFGEKKRGDGGVTLGEIEAEADAAAFFAADQNILFEHEFADVFEADGNFVQLAIEFFGELVNQFGDGKSFGDITGKIAHSGEVPNEKREDLMRVDEGAVAVDCADAVAVAVGGKAGVVFSGEDSLAEGGDVRLDGFRMNAAEAWVARAANFVAMDAVALEQFGK